MSVSTKAPADARDPFVHLHSHVRSPDVLHAAKALGQTHVAVENASDEIILLGREMGIGVIDFREFTIEEGHGSGLMLSRTSSFGLLALNDDGRRRIWSLRQEPWVAGHHEVGWHSIWDIIRTPGVFGLTGCPASMLNNLLAHQEYGAAEEWLAGLQSVLGPRLAVELQEFGAEVQVDRSLLNPALILEEPHKDWSASVHQMDLIGQAASIAGDLDILTVATNDVRYVTPEEGDPNDVFMREGCAFSGGSVIRSQADDDVIWEEAPPTLEEYEDPDHQPVFPIRVRNPLYLKSGPEMLARSSSYDWRTACSNTREVLNFFEGYDV